MITPPCNNPLECYKNCHKGAFPCDKPMDREKLIRLFTMDKPYVLSYEYRKKGCRHKIDLPVLNAMIKDGLVLQESKNTKTIEYRYIGPVDV
jgi:hypothetical protein